MPRRTLTALACLATSAALVLGATLTGAPALAATTKPHVVPPSLMPVDGPVPVPIRLAAVAAGTSCATPAADPVPDGQPITVVIAPGPAFTVGQIPATWWGSPPEPDPTWQLRFRGLMWLPTLAQRAFDDGQLASLDALVVQAVAAHTQNPDPGTATKGWDEGTALRRLEALTCLYRLTEDARLVAPMKADAAVILGPRYYGPPNYPVHNHGLMANLILLEASPLLGIPEWKTTALTRMQNEAPLVFSAKGINFEQAAAYHEINRRAWLGARDQIAAEPGTGSTVAVLDSVLTRARVASTWMTEPDGFLPQIGDTEQAETGVTGGSGTTGAFIDTSAGWVVGRWAWSDPATTFYVLRFGPVRFGHGHYDRGGLTFTTAGVRVLVGPGKYSYNTATAEYAYQMSPAANNVLVPTGTFTPSRAVTLKSTKVQSAAHEFVIGDSLYGPTHTRAVNVNSLTRTMGVSDTVSGTSLYRQWWNLDPAWTWVSTTVASGTTKIVFKHPSGKVLTITTNGRLSGITRGSTSPYSGWHYPAFGSQVPSNVVTIRNYAPNRTTTTFSVR